MKKLHEFATLAQAQAEPLIETKMVETGTMNIFLNKHTLTKYFRDAANEPDANTVVIGGYDITEVRLTTWSHLMTGKPFNFINGNAENVAEIMDLLIYVEYDSEAAEQSQIYNSLVALKADCVEHCNQVTYPYAGTTQEEFDACKLAYSELTTHELDWDGRKTHLKITLHEDLYEAVNVATFFTDAIYTTPENLGRPKKLHKAEVYIIDLANVRKTGKLFVNFNIKANATCELV